MSGDDNCTVGSHWYYIGKKIKNNDNGRITTNFRQNGVNTPTNGTINSIKDSCDPSVSKYWFSKRI